MPATADLNPKKIPIRTLTAMATSAEHLRLMAAMKARTTGSRPISVEILAPLSSLGLYGADDGAGFKGVNGCRNPCEQGSLATKDR
jgi:hypothetical protein